MALRLPDAGSPAPCATQQNMSSGRLGTAADVGRRYAEDSTAGGVRRAARPGIVLRIVWIIVIVICFAMTVVSLVRLYDVRSQRHRSLTSRYDDALAQDLPAVTICNVNPINLFRLQAEVSGDQYGMEGDRNLVRRAVQVDEETEALLSLQDFLFIYRDLGSSGEDLSAEDSTELRTEYAEMMGRLSVHTKQEIGHHFEEALVSCYLGEVPCDYSNFTQFYHDKFGNCFTFEADLAHQPIWKGGAEHGLTLNLYTHSTEYLVEDAAGFVVAVHGSRDTVFLEEEGVFAPKGKASYIALSKSKEQSVDDDCDDDEDDVKSNRTNIYAADNQWRYSRRGCQHGCLQRELYRRCGCCQLGIPCTVTFIDPDLRPTTTTTTTTTTTPPPTTASTTTTRNTADRPSSRKKRQARRRATVAAIPRCATAQANCSKEVLQTYIDGAMPCLSQCSPRCSVTKYSTRLSLTTLPSNSDTTLPRIPEGSGQEVPGFEPEGFNQPTQEAADLPTKQERVTEEEQPAEQPVDSSNRLSEKAERRKRNVPLPPPAEPGQSDVRIHVYFERLGCRVTESAAAPSTDWSEWMADVGGVTSLWVGLSVLGLMEVVHAVLELAAVAFTKCCAGGGSAVKPVAPSGTEP